MLTNIGERTHFDCRPTKWSGIVLPAWQRGRGFNSSLKSTHHNFIRKRIETCLNVNEAKLETKETKGSTGSDFAFFWDLWFFESDPTSPSEFQRKCNDVRFPPRAIEASLIFSLSLSLSLSISFSFSCFIFNGLFWLSISLSVSVSPSLYLSSSAILTW